MLTAAPRFPKPTGVVQSLLGGDLDSGYSRVSLSLGILVWSEWAVSKVTQCLSETVTCITLRVKKTCPPLWVETLPFFHGGCFTHICEKISITMRQK